jgi:hypothetical protein
MYVMGAGEPGSMRSEESAMDYAARNFVEFAALDDRVRTRLHDYFGVDSEDAAATKWLSFTAAHDDQAADVLAVARALSRVVIRPATDAITALELIDRFHLLAGDRLYARLSRPLFEAWKANASFQIELAGGGLEEGKVNFNHGQVGASLHDGFDIQGVTALNRIPRIQWNYRFCDALADIDLDGYSPWDLIRHPTYANSDPRQWNDKLVGKFGPPGYEVAKVGNVPALTVKDTSTCPRPEGRLTASEQAAALSTVSGVMSALETPDGFRGVVRAAAPTLAVALRDPEQSPLLAEVEADVLAGSSDDDLLGYYAARVNVERLTRTSSFVERPSAASRASSDAFRALERPISNRDELRRMRSVLEAEEEEQRLRAGALDARLLSNVAAAFGARAWLSTDNAGAFGYPRGTRFVAAETSDLQMLLAPRADGYDLLFAVARTKY